MKISKEFSKYAQSYDNLNSIQNLVAKKLVSLVKTEPQCILDLGCGSGAVCKAIPWHYKSLTGVDFAEGMLALHPVSKSIQSIYGDFNNENFVNVLHKEKFDFIFSSSSLQWADKLEKIFQDISALDTPVAFAIFTSNTFKTLNNTASLNSFLRTSEELYTLQEKYFNASFEIVEYKLEFENVRDMFQYIKKSGVSGSRKVLNYTETKNLMKNYPLNYLEFEVVFITSY